MSDVPVYDSLDKIYDIATVAKQSHRYDALIEKFTKMYGLRPQFIARSPGRVNLIGEHIDYCGFGVLPMAIERDVVIACATTDADTKVRLANVESKYEPCEFDYEENTIVTIDASKLEWSNYFKSGYKGMLERTTLKPKGLYILVDGTVPAGGGLSSSAAFVCASALTVVTANKLPITKQELTEIAIVAERNVGVNSGGMDQSASVFSQKNYALHVEFVPKLTTHLVRLPSTSPNISFVIANTLVKADKFVTAPKHYNLRVVETKIGALILSRKLGLQLVDSYKDLMVAHFAGSAVGEEEQYEKMVSIAKETFTSEGYTRTEMAALAQVAEDELVEKYMTRFPVSTELYRLQQRAVHVFGEALRVVRFAKICSNPPEDSAQVFEKLGRLMNESQKSCAELFDCSCPELDELTALALENGATASRLSGAGWGGATVSLVSADKVDLFIAAIKEKYYKKHFPDMTEDTLNDAILATQPCSGSSVFTGY
ncbi:galactokinase [Apophysomyces sp. BC1034]|nr:galactokinase [Apophysomyces sp. BC1015]KAG0181711.1 galactokinase [Apophysomyces sp. BC1021]KAG0191547.1 galactokinase [Apophysomyces sp. BC1034]